MERRFARPWSRERRARRADHGIRLQLPHYLFDRALQLGVTPRGDGSRVLLDHDVWGDADIFDPEPLSLRPEAEVRRRPCRTVDRRRRTKNSDQPPPGSRTDEGAEASLPKQPGHVVTAGASVLVDEHDLGTGDSGRRAV